MTVAVRPKPFVKTQPVIDWELLPKNFILPDDPVESINHPLIAAALTDALDVAGLILPSLLIASNFGLCVQVNRKIVVKAPDWVYIPSVKGILAERRSYTPITEGDLPAVVMEFLSETDGGEYSNRHTYPYGKWYFYEQILAIPIYVIFDAESGLLEVHGLESGIYRERLPDAQGRYWLESMGLFLGVWEGQRANRTGFWLRWWNESGEMLLWGTEQSILERSRAEQERSRAEQEHSRAEQERLRAEQERLRAEQERLRAEAAEQEIALLRQRLSETNPDKS